MHIFPFLGVLDNDFYSSNMIIYTCIYMHMNTYMYTHTSYHSHTICTKSAEGQLQALRVLTKYNVYTYTYMYIYMHIYTRMYKYIYMYIYTYIHTHTRQLSTFAYDRCSQKAIVRRCTC